MGGQVRREKLLIEALLSMGGKAEISSVLEYAKERDPSITRGEVERIADDSERIIRRGEELLLND
jgi:hypothetical protein